MSVVITCSIVICVFAYLAKIYTDALYQQNLLLEYLPSPETVKRYNGAMDLADDDRTQGRNDDRTQNNRNDEKPQDARNGDRAQETRGTDKTRDARDGDNAQDIRVSDNSQVSKH
ncbi:hypothetical protein Y032_0092g2543 [Ancylostoma ceylanicum]|nr:hypothetical protein Y032_0092g2543 [Ancylostoma ceylanicum]